MEEFANGFEFLEMLKKQGDKQTTDYSLFSRYIAHKARKQGVPISGQFELTPLCNFNCGMCYVHLNPEQMKGRPLLTVDEWKKLFLQACEAGMFRASLSGGECLTYPGFDELYLYLHSLGCEVGILSNGLLLDDQRIEFFKEHMPCRIQITLYGWNDDVYERVTGRRVFSKVIENVRKAIAAHLPVALAVTPCDFLGEDALETLRIAKRECKSVSINSGLFNPREETGRSGQRADSQLDQYLRIYRLMNELNGKETKEIDEAKLPPCGSDVKECSECGLRCGGGRETFVVDWKGTMMPCNRLNLICAFPLQEGFKAAWSQINHAANNWPRVPKCEGCAYRDVCNNCAGSILEYTESGRPLTELCEQTKFFVQHGVRPIPECEE